MGKDKEDAPWAKLPAPQIGVRQEDQAPLHRTRTYVWIRMPQVESQWNVVDMECYEEPFDLEFLGYRALGGGRLELRHRVAGHTKLLIVTELTPEPGKLKLVARPELENANSAARQVPDALPRLNLCFDVKRSRDAFDSYPDPFPEIVGRCFIFTDEGCTFLDHTVRRKLPKGSATDPRNNPPWIQTYVGVWMPVPAASTGDTWYNKSSDRFTIPIIGMVSRDKKHLLALANDNSDVLAQAWAPCVHIYPAWAPKEAPPADRRWYMNIYTMPNDPDALLKRVTEDFPNALKLKEKRIP